MNIIHQGSTGIGDVRRMGLATGELPNQPSIYGSKGQFTRLSTTTNLRIRIQNPLNFSPGKIGVKNQACFIEKHLIVTIFSEFCASISGTTILPNDGFVHWPSCDAIPDHGRFSLIGNPYCGNLLGLNIGLRHNLVNGFKLGFPDLHGVVFDPCLFWEILGKLMLGHSHLTA